MAQLAHQRRGHDPPFLVRHTIRGLVFAIAASFAQQNANAPTMGIDANAESHRPLEAAVPEGHLGGEVIESHRSEYERVRVERLQVERVAQTLLRGFA
jgi:hypothetical protein